MGTSDDLTSISAITLGSISLRCVCCVPVVVDDWLKLPLEIISGGEVDIDLRDESLLLWQSSLCSELTIERLVKSINTSSSGSNCLYFLLDLSGSSFLSFVLCQPARRNLCRIAERLSGNLKLLLRPGSSFSGDNFPSWLFVTSIPFGWVRCNNFINDLGGGLSCSSESLLSQFDKSWSSFSSRDVNSWTWSWRCFLFFFGALVFLFPPKEKKRFWLSLLLSCLCMVATCKAEDVH